VYPRKSPFTLLCHETQLLPPATLFPEVFIEVDISVLIDRVADGGLGNADELRCRRERCAVETVPAKNVLRQK
jgi:hypothetical protein